MNSNIISTTNYLSLLLGTGLFLILLNSSCESSNAQIDAARYFVKKEIVAVSDTTTISDESTEKSSDKKEKISNQNELELLEFKKDIGKRIAKNESKVKNMMKKSKKESSSFIKKLNLLKQENENLKLEVEEYLITTASKLERFKLKIYVKVDHVALELDQLNFQKKLTTDDSKMIPLPINSEINFK